MGDEAIGLALWFGFCFLVIVVILFGVRPWVLQRADQPGSAESEQTESEQTEPGQTEPGQTGASGAQNATPESSPNKDVPEDETSGTAQTKVEKGS